MNSLCIKTNNEDLLNDLQKEFEDFNMLNVSYSKKEFKSYKNIIIHYTGIDNELFYTKLATILSYIVINKFENDFIKNILISNYFYFDSYEIDKILHLCKENLTAEDDFSLANRQMILFDTFYEYISKNHSIILSGFINFRLKDYRILLENLVDFSVNEYIIDKEYLEFVSLLRLYINSQIPSIKTIHLISLEDTTLLLDENMTLIPIDPNDLNAKYLSDISFSINDYVLNALLNLLPQKIYLHLVAKDRNLEFIQTLQLIFESRVEVCTDCNICNLYKHIFNNTSGIEK